MRDRSKTAPRPTRVAWCLTTGQYVDERCERDHKPHDHHDVAIDYNVKSGSGLPLYRLDPVGTTYLLPSGGTLRLTKYEGDPFLDEPIEDKILPRYDWWSPMGGAAGGIDAVSDIWDGVNLRSGVWRTVPVAPERAAARTTYMRPNGEVWRLRDWRQPIGGGSLIASWTVMLSSGATTTDYELPDDACLVWAP